jgi:hypothetical protein
VEILAPSQQISGWGGEGVLGIGVRVDAFSHPKAVVL